jgi:Rab-GTPase-TBC domain
MGSGCSCVRKNKDFQIRDLEVLPTVLGNRYLQEEFSKKKEWTRILKKFSYFNNPILRFREQFPIKFNKLLLEGPPADIRWEVWKSALLYSESSQTLHNIAPEFLTLIEKDVERTFPLHPFFSEPSNLVRLKNLLIGVVRLNPELGYCQGMNFMAGIVLLVSSNTLEETIQIMNHFIHQTGAISLFESEFSKVLDLTKTFQKEFSEKIPSLSRHFEEIELDDHLWITKWFMTMFSYSFNTHLVIRLWDTILATGLDFMINLSLSILNTIKNRFKNKDLPGVLELFQGLRSADIDIEAVISISLKKNAIKKLETDAYKKGHYSDDCETDERFKLNCDSYNFNIEEPHNNLEFNPRDKNRKNNSLVIQQSVKII